MSLFCASPRLSIINLVVGSALVVFIMIARWLLAIIFKEPCKNEDLAFTGPGSYIAHMAPHSKVVGRETECTLAWGSALLGIEGEGLGFHGLPIKW